MAGAKYKWTKATRGELANWSSQIKARAKIVWNVCKRKGFSDAAAAAMCGNIAVESGAFNPIIYVKDSYGNGKPAGKSGGLIGFNDNPAKGMYAFTNMKNWILSRYNCDITASSATNNLNKIIEYQTEYIIEEYLGSQSKGSTVYKTHSMYGMSGGTCPGGLSAFKSSTNIGQATWMLMHWWIRPAESKDNDASKSSHDWGEPGAYGNNGWGVIVKRVKYAYYAYYGLGQNSWRQVYTEPKGTSTSAQILVQIDGNVVNSNELTPENYGSSYSGEDGANPVDFNESVKIEDTDDFATEESLFEDLSEWAYLADLESAQIVKKEDAETGPNVLADVVVTPSKNPSENVPKNEVVYPPILEQLLKPSISISEHSMPGNENDIPSPHNTIMYGSENTNIKTSNAEENYSRYVDSYSV